MNFKKNGGFTLVELIVVIAILGILAGIGIPAYGKYVEKAQTAVDEQNITMLHNAFVVACVGNNVDPATVTAVHVDWRNGNEFHGLLSVQRSGTDPVVDDFNSFVSEPIVFKKLGESEVADGIKNGLTGDIKVSYGNTEITVSGAAIEALKGSTFYGEGMTSEKLMNQIDNVAGIAGLMGTVANVKNTEGFADVMLNALDVDTTGMTLTDKQAAMMAKARELALRQLGWTEDDITSDNQHELFDKMDEIQNNALVLYTAQSTSSMNPEEAKKLLNGVDSTMIQDAMNGKLENVNMAQGMNQAALAYGMYYAYVNSDACTDPNLKGKNDIVANDVITALDNNPEFKSYMDSEQGTKDMDAYLQALGVINSSTQDPVAAEKLLSEGFASQDLINVLTQSMGK